MNLETIGKIRDGDGLTNEELEEAIVWFSSLEESLTLLGPKFYLAKVEVIRILESLKQFAFHRSLP
jgi:hypothetical protein